MLAQEKFNYLIKQIHPLLKEKGYSKGGTVFRKRQGDNWGVIGFVKDKWNRADRVEFSIEFGIYSLAVDKQLGWTTLPQKPITPDCHWREQTKGNMTDPGFEYWWDVNQARSLEELIEQVKASLLAQVLPKIDRYITDEQLKEYWLAGGSSVLSEFMRLKQLSILLKVSGEKEQLESILSQIEEYTRGTPSEEVAREHMQRMRAETPKKE